jgi:hypothetical protein
MKGERGNRCQLHRQIREAEATAAAARSECHQQHSDNRCACKAVSGVPVQLRSC